MLKCMLFLALVYGSNMEIQATDIKGRILDKYKKGIFAASIFLCNKKQIATDSDINGHFELSSSDIEETDTIVINAFGYTEKKLTVRNIMDQYDIILTEEICLSEIIVKAQSPISKFISISQIDEYDIYLNPIAQGDALQAVTSLPSSTSINEDAEPSFRGSNGSSSIIALNGFPITNAAKVNKINHYGSFGIFNPDILKRQYVYASNPPLTYGNTTAGLVELETKDDLERNNYNLGLNICGLSFLLSQKITQKSHIQAFGNCMGSNLIKAIQPKSFPEMSNFTAKDICVTGVYKIANNILLKTYNYYNADDYKGSYESYGYKGEILMNENKIVSINNVKFTYGKSIISFIQGYEFTGSRFIYGNMKNNESTIKRLYSANVKLYPNNKLSIQTGIDCMVNTYKICDSVPVYSYAIFPAHPNLLMKDNLSNKKLEGFIYANYEINNYLSAYVGARSCMIPAPQKNSTSYQGSLRYSRKKNNCMISGGVYNRTMSPNAYYLHFKQSRSIQLSADYVYNIPNIELYGSVYYKGSNDLLYINEENDANLYKIKTYGFEVSMKYSFASYFTFYVANSFIRQKMKKDFFMWVPGSYNLTYNIKTYLSYVHPQIGNLSISFTGRPGSYYTPICSTSFNADCNVYRPIYGQQNSQKYPSYEKIDIAYSRTYNFKTFSGLLYISVNNLLNKKNVMNNIYDNQYNIKSQRMYQKRILFMGVSLMF